jgi:peptidase E
MSGDDLNLALTSDFPSTTNPDVLALIRATSASPRVAWLSPTTLTGRERFPAAEGLFRSLGVPGLEYCDIDEEPNEAQLARLDEYDVVYLTGGDPVVFRRNIRQHGLAERLRSCVTAGRLLVAASGGAMQLTKNVSLFRLLSGTVDDVVGAHADYEALSMVSYEILPHLNRLDASFLERVRKYSELLSHDVVALEDGAAMIHVSRGDARCTGRAVRFRRGIEAPIDAAA